MQGDRDLGKVTGQRCVVLLEQLLHLLEQLLHLSEVLHCLDTKEAVEDSLAY